MRAGIIGLGHIAWRYDKGEQRCGQSLTHLSTYRSHGMEILAGVDPCETTRAEFFQSTGVPAHASIDHLLSQSPDVVSITSPTRFHAEHLHACLEAGVRHIWLEKPATGSPTQTLELAKRAEELDARVLVGFQRRYMPIYQDLLVSNLGHLEGVEITYSRGLETNGAHMVDLAVWLMGDTLPKIHGVTLCHPPRNVNEPSPSFILESDKGVVATVLGLDLGYHAIDFVVHYAEGRKAVRWGGQLGQNEVKVPDPLFDGYFRLGPEDASQPVQDTRSQLTGVFDTVLDDLLNGPMPQPRSNLMSAYLGQKLVSEVLSQCA